MVNYTALNMARYPRREHFEYFSAMPVPTLGVTVKLDVSKLVRFCKAKKCSFYMAMTHISCLAANRIAEFRRRTKNGGIIEYERCGTSHIELLPDGTYCYCTLWHDQPWDEFFPYAAACREQVRRDPGIDEDEDSDALYFITTLPWFHYEQISMPVTDPVLDNPRLCWGKYEEDFAGRSVLPYSVFVNHALMDGVHLAAFFRNLQEEIDALAF